MEDIELPAPLLLGFIERACIQRQYVSGPRIHHVDPALLAPQSPGFGIPAIDARDRRPRYLSADASRRCRIEHGSTSAPAVAEQADLRGSRQPRFLPKASMFEGTKHRFDIPEIATECGVPEAFGLGETLTIRSNSGPREVERNRAQAGVCQSGSQVREESPVLEPFEAVTDNDRGASLTPFGGSVFSPKWQAVGPFELKSGGSRGGHGPALTSFCAPGTFPCVSRPKGVSEWV
jgi:hypothetical protein